MRERVEQRGFAGVGVAHQRYRQDLAAHPRTALHVAAALELDQLVLEHLDAVPDQAPVDLDLSLAHPAEESPPAALAFKMGPAAHQTRGGILELRQFHLQLALVTPRAPGENTEYQAGAVDDRAIQRLFQIALLRRREFVVEHHRHGMMFAHGGPDLFHLARAGKQGTVGPLTLALDQGARLQAGAFCEQPQFLETLSAWPSAPKSIPTRTAAAARTGRSDIARAGGGEQAGLSYRKQNVRR